MFDYTSIEQYHARLQEATVTCVQTVEHYLRQIETARQLNAFTEVYAEEALAKARLLDAQRASGSPMGKLHGVVIGIKDVIAYKDHTLTAASGILKGFTSIYSATAVERLLQEEAIIIGNLNCDEFAMGSTNENSVYGKVLNARDESRVPGGSSGGSAVAVQAGLCMVSLGSDTGGSVRQPADFCGIIGLKPTYGRISRYGLIAYASSFDQIGIFGTTVQDVALLLEIMAGADDYDSTVSQQPVPAYSQELNTAPRYRIAWFEEALQHPSLDPEISTGILQELKKLEAAGHTVKAEKFELLDYIVPAYYVLTTAEASSNLSRYDGIKFGHRTPVKDAALTDFYKLTRSEGFGKEVKRRILIGTYVLSAGYYDAYYLQAQRLRRLIAQDFQAALQHCDLIAGPTTPTTAWTLGEKADDPVQMYLSDIYTIAVNLAGLPGLSHPVGFGADGLPVGLQLIGDYFAESRLLHAAHRFQHATDWHARRPACAA